MTINHQVRLAARPVGLPARTDWSFTQEPVGEPAGVAFIVRVLYISLHPAMRGWMNASRSYIPPVGIGEGMRALALGRVVAAKDPRVGVGGYVPRPLCVP